MDRDAETPDLMERICLGNSLEDESERQRGEIGICRFLPGVQDASEDVLSKMCLDGSTGSVP